MPNWREFFGGSYMTATDLQSFGPQGVTLTISQIPPRGEDLENMDGAKERRLVIHFREERLPDGREVKPWLPNVTTGTCMERMYESGDTNDWIGKPITLYFDPEVRGPLPDGSGHGKVGGIRVRGMPGLGRDLRFQIKMPKRRPLSIRLVDTAPQQKPAEIPTEDLDQVLADAELTVPDVDRWRESEGKPPVASLTDEQRGKLAGWLKGNDKALDQIRALLPTT